MQININYTMAWDKSNCVMAWDKSDHVMTTAACMFIYTSLLFVRICVVGGVVSSHCDINCPRGMGSIGALLRGNSL